MTDPGPSTPAVIPATDQPAPISDAPTTAGRAATPASSAAPGAPVTPAAGDGGETAPQLTKRQRAGLLVTLILGSLTAMPALAMDMYLPALPDVSGALGTEAATVQLTLTSCLLGLAVGQLIVGPMSDQFGRRKPLLIGLAIYVLASAACAFAPTIETLLGFRLIQGLAGASGVVIARAVVRDLYDGLAMARFFSTLMLVSGVAPVLAPVLGGQVLRFTDWRGVFLVLTGLGVVMAVVVLRKLPETLPASRRHGGGIPQALRAMRTLLADRVFTGYLIAGSFGFAGLFAYVSASPFVMQEIYGASPQTFSLLFMANSIGLVAFGQINGKILVGRVALDKVLAFGLGLTLLAALTLVLLTSGVFGKAGLLPVATGLFVLMSGMGLVMPNANSQGLMRASRTAGSASALLGTAQFLVGALASPLVGIAGERTAVPMALVQVSALLIAAAGFLGLCRPWRTRS